MRQDARCRHRRKADIKIVLREIGCEDVMWIKLAHNRLHWWPFMNAVMNIWLNNCQLLKRFLYLGFGFFDSLSVSQLVSQSDDWVIY